jgi:hypothetical protein
MIGQLSDVVRLTNSGAIAQQIGILSAIQPPGGPAAQDRSFSLSIIFIPARRGARLIVLGRDRGLMGGE